MRTQLPDVFADVVAASVDTQLQPIRTSQVPTHYARRMCLVGDAAVAIQPMTGAGVFKAYENARTLALALATRMTESDGPTHAATSNGVDAPGMHRDRALETSLQEWSRVQTDLDERLLATGYAMEDAFIWNTIDLATATEAEVQGWWQRSIHYPPEYSYLAMG